MLVVAATKEGRWPKVLTPFLKEFTKVSLGFDYS